MTWRPIDLAPRDGTAIVVAFRSSLSGEITAAVVSWADDMWRRSDGGDLARTIADIAVAWVEMPEATASG